MQHCKVNNRIKLKSRLTNSEHFQKRNDHYNKDCASGGDDDDGDAELPGNVRACPFHSPAGNESWAIKVSGDGWSCLGQSRFRHMRVGP